MGMLITQKGNYWNIDIREKWKITYDDSNEIFLYLLTKKIEFSVTYIVNNIIIEFDNYQFSADNFDTFKEILDKLLGYKLKYGKLRDDQR